ncbi:hypothetical protein Y032_0071g547 [Ancylostoma ceylanicum]|uniref:Uncharacterized protein n=1 Tax=Ancylostoma ceylanicum TaxID=53326 RepID=A0A016TXA1_9BILA|nr:hypothetical protein Y032_0071g547 [Ancylostoma ceylanicum]
MLARDLMGKHNSKAKYDLVKDIGVSPNGSSGETLPVPFAAALKRWATRPGLGQPLADAALVCVCLIVPVCASDVTSSWLRLHTTSRIA